MLTDIQIAQQAKLLPITDIAEKLGFTAGDIIPYGHDKAKISAKARESVQNNPDAKLILVTAISPTPAGEGKTTTSIGLGDALSHLGKKTAICLREPSLGPVFGVKGGAAGGGYAQVVPMEDINLHFTGDFHAIGAANNLLAAMLDNHIYQGNALRIDPKRVVWHRCVDLNDRQLRRVVVGGGARTDGILREDVFDITVASEVMAAFCLASGLKDLKERLARIIVAYNYDNEPVTAGDLKAEGAMAALLKDAVNPNLVQTLEHTPVLIHGGPFANIAHGCNSVIATKLGMKVADYVVTEAGFAADLGAEKFVDIKCRMAGLNPSAVVLVATIRALKYHGGVDKKSLVPENVEAMEKGCANLLRHIDNIRTHFGKPVVVAINRFPTDTDAEIARLRELMDAQNVPIALSTVFSDGGKGGVELAQKVLELCDRENTPLRFVYDLDMSIKDKITAVATKIYRADGVSFTKSALKDIERAEQLGYGNAPICMAKTQYSFSDQQNLINAPTGFEITVRNVRISAGAGFLVALTGEIMTMPGLPKVPAACNIDVDEQGNISGLF